MADPLREAIRRYVAARQRRDLGRAHRGSFNAEGHMHERPPIWDDTRHVCELCCAWAVLVAIADEPDPPQGISGAEFLERIAELPPDTFACWEPEPDDQAD
jgi:hypothetical protein